jgi:hypothetical protein
MSSGVEGALLVCLGDTPVPVGCGFSLLQGYKVGYGAGLIKSDGNIIVDADLNNEKKAKATKVSEVITNTSSYAKTMTITAEASASLWGVNVSSSVASTSSRDMTAESISFTIATIVTTSLSTLSEFDDKRLSDTAAKLLTNAPTRDTCQAFVSAYGTHCLVGYYKGGSFIGSVNIKANSVSDKSSLDVKLKASFSGGGASGSFSQDVKNIAATNTVTVKQDELGEITNLTASDVSTLQKANDDFLGKITAVGGGSSTIAVLYPWSFMKAIRDLVPTDLIKEHFVFDVSGESIRRARTMWGALDYLRQSCSAELGNYLKGGPATKHCDNPDDCEIIFKKFQVLQEKVGKVQDEVNGLSIEEITSTSTGKLDTLNAEVNQLEKDFDDIFNNDIAKIVYRRQLNFRYTDGNYTTIDGPAEIISVGRDLTSSTVMVKDKGLFIKYVWNPVEKEFFDVNVYVEGFPPLNVRLSNLSTGSSAVAKDGNKTLVIGPWGA